MNSSSVPSGWYSATSEFRPIAHPYVANKSTKTIYASCKSLQDGTLLDLSLTQMPGQPISVTINTLGGGGIFADPRTNDISFTLREYGCEQYADAVFFASNKEFNPIEEKKPDGTGVASFQDSTRGRINDVPKTIKAADAATLVALLPVQNDFLQNLDGKDGILGRCITSNSFG